MKKPHKKTRKRKLPSSSKRPGRTSKSPPPPPAASSQVPADPLLQKLEHQLLQYQRRFEIFREATVHLTLGDSLENILESLTEKAAEFFEAGAVSCMLWDESKKFMVRRAGFGFKADISKRAFISAEDLKPYLESGQDYLVIPDLFEVPLFAKLEVIQEEQLHTALAVAMRLASEVLGIFLIFSRDCNRQFTPAEIDNARLFAQQAAIAVNNIQLVAELKEEIQIANTLLRVAEDIGTLGSLDEVLNRIVGIILKVLNFKVCAVFLWNKESGFFMPAKAVGLMPHRLPFFHTLVLHRSDLNFMPEEKRQRSVILSEASSRRFPLEKLSGVLGCKDLCFVPLVIKEQLLGAIVAGGFSRTKVFNDKDEMFLRGIAAQAAIAIDDANLFEELEKSFWDTIKSLAAAIEAKDHYTHDHSEAVIQYGSALAKELNLSMQDQELIRKACLLHDVGKIGVDDEILRKRSPLTPAERQVIEKHPVIGQEILSSVRALGEVSRIVRYHHEHFNGNGYPDHLKGEQIPLLSRILQIADSFDAMVSERPYRKALSREEAIEELRRNAGKQFDPNLVRVFLQILQREDMQEISTH